MNVRCPQCGTEFDKDTNEFCPNPACGYPSAFILAPEADEQPLDDMTRRPGEQATAPQPIVAPPTPSRPPPAPVPTTPMTTPVPAPAAPPPRRRRQVPLIALIGIGFAIGVVIILVIVLLTRGNGGGPGGSPGATTGASPTVTPECTTAFFQGSLGERVLGPCPAAMRGTDVQQLQQQLNRVLVGQRVLTVDGSFGPRTATAVKEYQQIGRAHV